MRHLLTFLCAAALFASQQVHAQQEIRPSDAAISEAFTFDIRPERERELSRYIDSLVLTERQERALELQAIHQYPLVTLVFELSKYTPYRFKPEVDTFFLRNDMRRDLNPVGEDQLLFKLPGTKTRLGIRVGR